MRFFYLLSILACAALRGAARNGHTDVVEYLVEQGADVNFVDWRGDTALRGAARYGHLAVVEFLVGSGADVNAANDDGQTALLIAAEGGHLSVVEYLVEQGADVNFVDWRGDTALRGAARYGHLAVVEFLVGSGADVNATTSEGRTPRDLTECGTAVAEYLASVGGEGDCFVVDCYVGKVVGPGLSCTTSDGTFSNVGGGCFVYTPLGSGRVCGNFNINGLRGTRSGDNFRFTAVP